MDWANERWVRLYTRDTTTWKMLDWRARTVLMHMLRKVDRAGVLEVGDTGTMGLAAVIELPLEVVEPGIERLLHPRLRVVIETPTAYVLPKYLDAQEAVQTTNHRSAEYRARKRDYALAAAKPAIAELVRLPAPARTGDDVTPRDGAVTSRDASITRGHATSQTVDLDSSDRVDPRVEVDPPSRSIVTKRDADTTPRDETITPHHATSQHVTPILSDPKDLSPSARAIQPCPAQEHVPPDPSVSAVSPPAHAREDIARTQPAAESAPDPATSLGFCNRPRILQPATAPRAATRADLVEATAGPYDPADPFARGRLAQQTYRRVSDARMQVAAELKLPAPIPFPEVTPSSRTRGFVELSDRIREEGALAPVACDAVVANLTAQARSKRSIDWLAERAFGDKAWANARDGIDPSARLARPAAGRSEPPSMPTPPKFAPEPERPPMSAEDRAELAALADRLAANPDAAAAAELECGRLPSHMPTVELVKRFGNGQRAPASSAGPNPDETSNRRRKAST